MGEIEDFAEWSPLPKIEQLPDGVGDDTRPANDLDQIETWTACYCIHRRRIHRGTRRLESGAETPNVDGVSVFLKSRRNVTRSDWLGGEAVMTFKLSFLLAVLVVALTACGSSPPPPQEQKPQRKESVFDPWTGTIDRAKGVQQTVDDQAAEQRKKIEAAER